MNDTLPDPATLAAYSDARLAMMPRDERDELARRLASAGRRDEAQRVRHASFRAGSAVEWPETIRMPGGGGRAGAPRVARSRAATPRAGAATARRAS